MCVWVCVNIQCLFYSFWLASLCIIGSRFIHFSRTNSDAFLFYGWVIFHCIYELQLLYPFICWWTSRLLPCLNYYKQCCNEHLGICIYFNYDFLRACAQYWNCWVRNKIRVPLLPLLFNIVLEVLTIAIREKKEIKKKKKSRLEKKKQSSHC